MLELEVSGKGCKKAQKWEESDGFKEQLLFCMAGAVLTVWPRKVRGPGQGTLPCSARDSHPNFPWSFLPDALSADIYLNFSLVTRSMGLSSVKWDFP